MVQLVLFLKFTLIKMNFGYLLWWLLLGANVSDLATHYLSSALGTHHFSCIATWEVTALWMLTPCVHSIHPAHPLWIIAILWKNRVDYQMVVLQFPEVKWNSFHQGKNAFFFFSCIFWSSKITSIFLFYFTWGNVQVQLLNRCKSWLSTDHTRIGLVKKLGHVLK